MVKNLVIVESPAKAKTIEGFLGTDFLVKSSYGHVRDLLKKELSVDVDKGFDPTYEISPDKKNLVSELKSLANEAEMVWLATDEDREGEAISWHLQEALDLETLKTRRITFNEITKTAILRAIDEPREINHDLVMAQQARRVLDRLVGFELSPLLWKKVKPALSAGRVQSVTVRLVVDRERDIMNFTTESAYKVTAHFLVKDKHVMKADLDRRFTTKEEARTFLEKCKGARFTIESLITKPGKKSPAAPFTTSTLQQEASRKLGYSVSQTMSVAQKLYEQGLITYMRTDSVNLSDTALDAAKAKIVHDFGPEYSNPRKYKTKNKSAQEAHEAIRPTYLQNPGYEGDRSMSRLYELIWKRTVASQMTDARLEKTTAKISVSTGSEEFVAYGEVMRFDGFLKIYLESSDEGPEEEKGMLPPLAEGENLALDHLAATQRFTHHPPRYTEASLVKKLEEQGIGRPSTYAPTISTIQKRGYVVKEDREGTERKYQTFILKDEVLTDQLKTETTGAEKAKLFPTDIGMVVNDFLVEHFQRIMDFGFTASVEKEFDEIAQGKIVWNSMIDKFYSPFHNNISETLEHSQKATGERLLGEEPATGLPVFAKIGRYGPMIQIGETESEDKPRFASLHKEQSIASISLEEALDLFKLPRNIGVYDEQEVVIGVGKFGPYVRFGKSFVSIPKGTDDPLTIELPRAIELIDAKREIDKNRIIKTFEENDEVQVLNGRYGPYISFGRKNFRIPKGQEPAELTLEQCLEIIEKAPKKPKGKRKKS